jgi:hypothetical protein
MPFGRVRELTSPHASSKKICLKSSARRNVTRSRCSESAGRDAVVQTRVVSYTRVWWSVCARRRCSSLLMHVICPIDTENASSQYALTNSSPNWFFVSRRRRVRRPSTRRRTVHWVDDDRPGDAMLDKSSTTRYSCYVPYSECEERITDTGPRRIIRVGQDRTTPNPSEVKKQIPLTRRTVIDRAAWDVDVDVDAGGETLSRNSCMPLGIQPANQPVLNHILG